VFSLHGSAGQIGSLHVPEVGRGDVEARMSGAWSRPRPIKTEEVNRLAQKEFFMSSQDGTNHVYPAKINRELDR
jgi:hypothetical protein